MSALARISPPIAPPIAAAILATLAVAAAPASAAHLQCVAFARAHSDVALHGNARDWWQRAQGRYARGATPAPGAILALRGSGRMPAGHVAVVTRVLDPRHVLIDHANWSRPGAIERGVLAEDVSPAGNWSAVRVWHALTARLGQRTNPAFGFIYARRETGQLRAPSPHIEPAVLFTPTTRPILVAASVALYEP